MYRLRGHKGQVTQARFMQRCNVLISRYADVVRCVETVACVQDIITETAYSLSIVIICICNLKPLLHRNFKQDLYCTGSGAVMRRDSCVDFSAL